MTSNHAGMRRVRFGAAAAVVVLLVAVAPALEAQELDCVVVPGVNDRCPVWTAEYPPADAPADSCTEEVAQQVVRGDGIYLSATRICEGFDVLTVAYDADGSLRWARTYEGAAGGRDYAHGMAVSPDGRRVYVVGSEDVGASDDWLVIAYDAATGAREWVARHDGPAGDDDEAWVAAVSDDGERLYVAGFDREEKADGTRYPNTATIAYDASTGERAWVERFDGDPSMIDFPRAIGVDGDRVVVTGSSLAVLVAQDLQTVAYRDDREAGRAEELWRARYDGGDWDQPLAPCLTRRISICLGLMGSVAVTGDTVAVAATSFVEPATDDAVWTTIAYDLETGARRWLRTFGDPSLQNKANAIAASPDGTSVYVTGFINDEVLFDGVGHAATVAYDTATGAQQWRSTHALPGVEDASGMGLAIGEDHVYVSGAVQLWPGDGLRADVLTLAHDAETGTAEWVARYNRDGTLGIGDHDNGNWAGLSDDGSRLFVGGGFANTFRVDDPGDYWDFGLVAYET